MLFKTAVAPERNVVEWSSKACLKDKKILYRMGGFTSLSWIKYECEKSLSKLRVKNHPIHQLRETSNFIHKYFPRCLLSNKINLGLHRFPFSSYSRNIHVHYNLATIVVQMYYYPFQNRRTVGIFSITFDRNMLETCAFLRSKEEIKTRGLV